MTNSLPLFPFNKGTQSCGVLCKRNIVELQWKSKFNVIGQYTFVKYLSDKRYQYQKSSVQEEIKN